MTPGQAGGRMRFVWRLWPLLIVLPAVLVRLCGVTAVFLLPPMPIFILAAVSMFISLPLFRNYKNGLIALSGAAGTADEGVVAAAMVRQHRSALWGSLFPAWLGAGGWVAGLDSFPVFLLISASLIIWFLYRPPRQLH